MRHRIPVVIAVATTAALTGCAGAGASQSGPLEVGGDAGDPTSTLCGPMGNIRGVFGMAEVIRNPGPSSVTLVDVNLVAPVNLTKVSAAARPMRDGDLAFYDWYSSQDVPADEAPFRRADGFVLEPHSLAGVAVMATVDDRSRPASARQLTVTYRANGSEYEERTGVSYQWEPSGCD